MATALPRRRLRAVIFDLDGVLTDTARLHFLAWKETFDAFLSRRGDTTPFTEDDYLRLVDGRPRAEGVRAFLAARGVALPAGAPADSPDKDTLWGVGNRKNARFRGLVRRLGVQPLPGSVDFVEEARGAGLRTAVVSSSRNCAEVLDGAGLAGMFDVVVDGTYASEHHLAGKPAPDTFVHAAGLLGLAPEQCAVIEDAVAGVRAGSAGDFGVVVGVDRGAGRAALQDGGADVVVNDLGELSLD